MGIIYLYYACSFINHFHIDQDCVQKIFVVRRPLDLAIIYSSGVDLVKTCNECKTTAENSCCGECPICANNIKIPRHTHTDWTEIPRHANTVVAIVLSVQTTSKSPSMPILTKSPHMPILTGQTSPDMPILTGQTDAHSGMTWHSVTRTFNSNAILRIL